MPPSLEGIQQQVLRLCRGWAVRYKPQAVRHRKARKKDIDSCKSESCYGDAVLV